MKQKESDEIWDMLDLGDENASEFKIGINDLKPQKKLQRLMYLWKKTWQKTKGGSHILRTFFTVHKQIVDMGSTKNLMSDTKA